MPWTEDWIPPPGYAEVISELSSGRPEEGERRFKELFAQFRSPVWRRRGALALGVARLRRREFTQAHRAFGEAERGGGPLAPFASLERAQALLGLGKAREAAELIARATAASTDPVLADDFAIARAQALVGIGDRAEARHGLAAHLASTNGRDRGRVLEAAARIAEEGGDLSDALGLWRRIYFEEPRSAEAARAAARLAAVVPASRRFTSSDLDNAAARSRVLIASGDGKGALATWDFVLGAVQPSLLSAPRRLDLAEAAIEAREHDRARALLGTPPTSRAETKRGLLLARALFGLGRDTEAISVLRTAAEGPGEEGGQCRFLLATALDQADRDREALEQFLRYTREYRDGERLAGSLWRAGWLSFRLGRREEAQKLFQALLDRPGAAAYHPSALYWLARASESARGRAGALGYYHRLVHDFTRDYYGLLAARRLTALGQPALSTARTTRVSASSPAREGKSGGETRTGASLGRPPRAFCLGVRAPAAALRVLTGCEFETAGLSQDAEREYEAASAAGPDRAVLLRLSEFALHRGDRTGAIARLKGAVPDYLAASIESLPRRYWEVLYPRKEWSEISEYSGRRHLDPALVCGLILQESAFNPLAVSGAGAMGLMQVLPGTGREAALADGATGFTPARLLEPATNIRLGTWHFAALVARCGGRVELALAAYNAGETRLERWRGAFGTTDPTTFIEDVPYTETRLYVKRILSHAAMYRAIYGM